MPNEPIDLNAHRERRAREQKQRARSRTAAEKTGADSLPPLGPGEVPCARCNAPISRRALRCMHCGVHFNNGRAEAFAPQEKLSRRAKLVIAVVAVAMLAAGLSTEIQALFR